MRQTLNRAPCAAVAAHGGRPTLRAAPVTSPRLPPPLRPLPRPSASGAALADAPPAPGTADTGARSPRRGATSEALLAAVQLARSRKRETLRSVDEDTGRAEEAEAAADAPALSSPPSSSTPRRRGRPPGKPAWNKGRSTPPETRAKIAASARARHAADGGLREAAAAAARGRAPWNKGATLPPATRTAMSAAKLGRETTPATRARMAAAASGRVAPPAARAALSAARRGVPLAPKHRAAIGAAARRRHAAERVLAALQDAYAGLTPGSPPPSDNGGAGKVTPASTPPPSPCPPVSGVMADYMASLRELRSLQAEVAPWTDAFREAHGRKPRMADVEAAGVPWLSAKYRQYAATRARVLGETRGLRPKLAGARTAPPAAGAAPQTAPTSSPSGPTPPVDIAKRLAAVERYKKAARAAVTAAAAAQPPPAPRSAAGAPLPALIAGSSAPRVRAAVAAAAEYRAKRDAAKTAASAATPPDPSAYPQQHSTLAQALEDLQEARAVAAAAKERLAVAAAAAAAAAVAEAKSAGDAGDRL